MVANTSLNGCNPTSLYPPFNKYLMLFSIIQVFFNRPSVVLLGDIKLIFVLENECDPKVASINSESLNE